MWFITWKTRPKEMAIFGRLSKIELTFRTFKSYH